MKPALYCCILLLLTSNIITNGQDSTKTKTPVKRSVFGQLLRDVGNEYLQLKGINVNSAASGTSTSSRNGSSFINGKVVNGEWRPELGAGGSGMGDAKYSPRNQTYLFDITQDNAEIKVTQESTNDASVEIYSSTGQLIGHSYLVYYTSFANQLRAGTYTAIVSARRGTSGKYRIEFNGPITNIRKKSDKLWTQDFKPFGEEGGGGSSNNFFGPRSHAYTFEPALDSWFDVQAESNGVPIRIAIIDPTGKVESHDYSSSDGISFKAMKASQKGKYQVWVATQQVNGRGSYKLEILGNIEQEPVRIPTNQKTLKAQFPSYSKRHEYRIPAHVGNLEIMYRSTNTPADFTVYDAYNQEIRPHFNADYSRSSQLQDKTVAVKQDGLLKLVIETKEATVGDYELMVWGNFDDVVATGAPVVPKVQSTVSKPTVVQTAAKVLETVLLSGRIRLPGTSTSYSGVKVQYSDLKTGTKLGETSPDPKGNYTLNLPQGREYAITATTEDGAIASSQHVDLTRKTAPNERISLDEIMIISASDVGKTITLLNILFETGKDRLLPASYAELNRVVTFMKASPTMRVEISGHTDRQGNPLTNQKLSTDRAISVSYYLQGNGIAASQIVAIGWGSSRPVGPQTTAMSRDKSRRVEFKILSK